MTDARFDPPLSHCPICRSPRLSRFDRDYRGVRIDACRACGVRFMNPQYSDAHLTQLYASYIAEQDEAHSARRKQRRRIAKESHIALVERFVRPGRFLAIGCGDGTELEIALRRGWDVVGYDVDEATTARVAARLSVPVLSGPIEDVPLEADSFSCVFMDQVIEHPKDPAVYLRIAHRLLQSDGVLYIGTPNVGSLTAGFKTALGRIGLRRARRGRHYATWHHLFYFTPLSLTRMLEAHGFEVLALEGDPKPKLRPNAATAVAQRLLRRFPRLDSSQRAVARVRK